MFVALGADHAGFELKESLKRALEARGVAWHDVGTTSTSSVDYPDYAAQVAEAVVAGKADRGILVCGSGIGMAIAANKVRGIRAAPILDVESAVVAREHNDLNVLALSGRRTSVADAERIVGRVPRHAVFGRPARAARAQDRSPRPTRSSGGGS